MSELERSADTAHATDSVPPLREGAQAGSARADRIGDRDGDPARETESESESESRVYPNGENPKLRYIKPYWWPYMTYVKKR